MLTDAEGRAATSSLLAAARSAQQTWRETGLAEREKTLCRLRQELFSRRQQLLHELSGCRPRRQAELLSSELIPLLDSCRYLEKHTRSLLKPRRIGWSGRPNWLFGIELEELREPHGLILIIGPSNYPLFLPGSQALFALAAGNGVAFKPAPGCSAPLRLLAEAIRAAGMPEGLVTLLPEEPEGLDQVLPQVDKLVLTGSQKTGEQVLPMAARHLISGVAELSGCDLLWAHPEADLDLVASAAVFALSLNAGRTCMAPRRLLVADNLLAQFREALARAIAQRGSFVLEPSISSRVAEALQGGAGYFVEHDGGPVFLRGAPELWRDGVFGPVAVVEGYGSEDQAWKLALDSPSALTTSLFGPEAWARGLLERLPGGVIFVNEVVVPSGDPRLAFGGNRVSGYGRTRGAEGLYEMTRLKSVATRRGGRQLHLRPPTDIDHFILHGYLEICHAPGIVQKGRALAGMILSIARERAKA